MEKKIIFKLDNWGILLSSISISIVFLFVFAFSINPFLLNMGGDSAVYQQMGQAIVLGKIPYVDLFEGKGFLMFLFQAVGLYISDGHWGLMTISIVNLAICIYFWFKTTLLYVDFKTSWIPILFVLALMGASYTNSKGNGTEFWSMPYISYAIYVVANYFKSEKLVKFRDCFLIGVGMGVITFIRMNNMAPICIACLVIFVDYICKKEYKNLFRSIAWGFAGFTLSCIFTIFLFWILYGSENVYSLFFGTFIYNFSYFGEFGKGTLLQMYFYVSIIVCSILIFVNWKKYKKETLFVVLAFAFTYLTMGKAYFLHYFEISFPLYIIALSCICDSNLYKEIPHKKYLLCGIIIVSLISVILMLPHIKQRFVNSDVMEAGLKDIKAKLLALPENERDSIWNSNTGMDGCLIMQTINKIPMNRLFIKSKLNVDLKDIGTIQEYRPLYIMTKDNYKKDSEDKADSVYIVSNYVEIFRTQMLTDGISHVVFYKRK